MDQFHPGRLIKVPNSIYDKGLIAAQRSMKQIMHIAPSKSLNVARIAKQKAIVSAI
jgi:hypothetical protein